MKFLTTRSRGTLIVSIAGVFVVPILLFAYLYWRLDLLRDDGSPVENYGQALFFSLMIQTTSGFVGITTTAFLGRLFVAVQVLIGVSWAAFLPAMILIRLTHPDTRSLIFGNKMAFNPDSGEFAIRYRSATRLLIFNTNLTVWARIPAPKSGDWNNVPVHTRSHIEPNHRFGPIRPDVPYIVYTDPNRDASHAPMPAVFPEKIEAVLLDPSHFKGFETEQGKKEPIVTIDIAGETNAGSVHAFHEYRFNDIICGYPVNVQNPFGPKYWENFNEFVSATDGANGHMKCLGCGHHPTCNLANKFRGAP